MTDKVIYEKWENGERVVPSGWQQIINTPKGKKKTVTENKIFENDTPLYPARQWIGLTDNEKLASIREWAENNTMRGQELIGLCDAIEQALKEKNS